MAPDSQPADLEPIAPEEAVNWYLEDRAHEVSENTIQAHGYRLGHFVRWSDETGIENLNELSGRKLQRYRLWRREDGDLNNVTMVTQLSTLRVFIRWCESIDAVESGLSEKIMLPSLAKNEDRREAMLGWEDAKQLIEYLRTFDFGSRTHTLIEILWHTGMRIGAAHSLDVEDYDEKERCLEVRHRPDTGTRLKNADEAERYVSLSNEVCDVLDGHIQYKRISSTDEFGRNPLFTSRQGRLRKSSIRDNVYQVTRPCEYTGNCPHDREIESCEAMHPDKASTCPSSESPHAIRRGSITHHLSQDVPEKVVSDRMNVGLNVLEKHYDRRTERERAEQRRSYLDRV
ncbi:site-specific integrase [Halobacteria archaeon AArc-curdl1]|uniref:Site-specific integrase n=1 Tax=Natronosalvus hydrolyticus TaxID=2979988 RepID=A0AAP2Z928_9EURY|nr:site-specific integrase [Halobacteria archaeon AArc-curdl1]